MNAAKKKGLGRGLSALFGDIEKKSEKNRTQVNTLPIADIQRNKYQPRSIFDESKLEELSHSIKKMELFNQLQCVKISHHLNHMKL